MGALRRRPAPEENVYPDAEIDQCDQPQPGVKRAVGGHQNQGSFHRHTLPHQGILGFGPDANAIELLLQAANVGYVPAFDAAS